MIQFNPFPHADGSEDSAPTIRPVLPQRKQQGPVGRVVEIGGGGARLELELDRLGQLAVDPDPSVALSGQVGGHVKVEVASRWLLAAVRSLRLGSAESASVIADVDFLGEGEEHEGSGRLVNFRRGITVYPTPGSRVHPVSGDDMKQMFAADERAHIEIGTVYPTKDVRGALYVDALLGKHFALLGSTGTGKSTSAALIMHRICELAPEGHIVMIDPHGEYSAAFKATGELYNVDNLAMPYWLMNFEEHCEVFVTSQGAERQRDTDILAKCLLIARGKNRAAEGLNKLTVDSPIPYTLSDLTSSITNEMGLLNKATDTAPYMRLKGKIDELKADPRYQFMFSGMLIADSMTAFIGKIFRLPARGKPISIIDVSGVPSDIVSVVVAMLSRLVFDYAIWSRNEVPRPVLLVCEEAHRYVPSDTTGGGQAVRKVLERIAKEGRKYGVALGLITQRPSDLAEGVLSQCGTIIAMRLNNERDQAFVRSAMPEGARGFLDTIPALRNRECIVCGEGVSIPIRVSFDDLERDRRPASSDPAFSELWSQSGDEEAMVQRVVKRWRSQGR
ncbi:ATPase [Sphingomonas deserti]|uniref:ATPase n=2 Tax=Allosphingosinicella deserti TaxID=2116704 RepID=A0A2P7QGW2_9SPHN|nr:ATP-binding protein [Sphingomonas deserti]PSJ37156.1 ATPase [Sphingomonas deserti]